MMTNPAPDEDGPSQGPDGTDPDPAINPLDSTDGDASRPGLLRGMWQGAKLGLKWVAYIVGPIVVLVDLLGLALSTFAMAAGRGWGVPSYPLLAIRAFLGCEILGVMIGATIGLLVALIRRVWPTTRTPGDPGAISPIDVAPTPPRRRVWAWLAGTLLVLAFLVLAGAFGFGIYVGRSVDRRLVDAIEAADRDDPNWRIDDLMAAREVVPDEEDSALVVARALALLPDDWPTGPKPKPGEPLPPENDLVTAIDRLHGTPENTRLDDATADRLRRERDALAEAVQIARTLTDYRRGRHELVLGPTLLDTRLPETQASRNAARLLEIDAAVLAQDGDLNAALDSSRAIIGVGRSIGNEPFTISQLVRIAEGGVAVKAARRVLGQGEASDAALARLQALMLDELERPVMLHAFQGERAVLAEIIRRIAAGEMPISALSEGGEPYDPAAPPKPITSWGRLMFENQRAVGLELTNQLVAIARQPDPSKPAMIKAWQAEIDRIKRDPFMPWTAALPLLMTPALEAGLTAESRYHAELGSMAILLAAERHRLKAGDWPGSIAALDPAILAKPPVDPFTGQPFRMERKDGQFLVYSLGPNRKDEHGALDPKRWRQGGPDDSGAVAWDAPLRRVAPKTENPAQTPENP